LNLFVPGIVFGNVGRIGIDFQSFQLLTETIPCRLFSVIGYGAFLLSGPNRERLPLKGKLRTSMTAPVRLTTPFATAVVVP